MKTAKKEIHPTDFMNLVNGMLVHDINTRHGLKGRLAELFKKNQVES